MVRPNFIGRTADANESQQAARKIPDLSEGTIGKISALLTRAAVERCAVLQRQGSSSKIKAASFNPACRVVRSTQGCRR
jgi:hypothetical protein